MKVNREIRSRRDEKYGSRLGHHSFSVSPEQELSPASSYPTILHYDADDDVDKKTQMSIRTKMKLNFHTDWR